MPPERFPLLASMVLQGVVSLTFGLAFVGLWRAFRRRSAMLLAVAFFTYAAGVWLSGASLAFSLTREWPLLLRGAIGLPLLYGAMLFRPAADELAGRGRTLLAREYVIAFAAVTAVLIFGQGELAIYEPEMRSLLFPYIVPRVILGAAFLWASLPVLRVRHADWRAGYGLVGGALVALALRTFASVAFELWQVSHGATQQPESSMLSIVQVGLMIVLGVSASLLLMDAESRRAMDAARTIQETSEALRGSEARFRFVAEHSSDLQVLIDEAGVLRYVAASSEYLLGIAPADLEGKRLDDVMHPADRPAVHAALESLARTGERRTQVFGLRLQHRSGEWRQFEASGQGRTDSSAGTRAVLVLSMRDVTEQRRLEAYLLQAQKLESLGAMAGSIAHDFNNTLAAVRGGIDLLRDELPAEHEALKSVEELSAAVLRGSSLTGKLLSFARRREVHPERFDVVQRVRDLEGMIVRVVGRAIEVQIELPSTALMVRADPGQFDQVLINLATNGRDSMPQGGRLTIRVVEVDGDAPSLDQMPNGNGGDRGVEAGNSEPAADIPRVRITVSDTGEGIPPELINRIFEPFFTTKGEGRGTGLGLAAAYGFAKQAGGALSVESVVGEGSRFTIELPLDVNRAPSAAPVIAPNAATR